MANENDSQTDTLAGSLSRRSLLGTLTAGAASALASGPSLAQPNGRVNRKLLLSGGGIKGAFQAGAIMQLLKSGFKPQVIYAVSAGALNGAFLADRAFFLGKPRGEYFSVLGKPVPPTADVTLPVDWPFIGEQLVEFWKDNVKGSNSLIRRRWAAQAALSLLFRNFNGIFDVTPLRTLIRATIDPKRMANSGVPFGCVATNIDTGESEYLFNNDAGVIDAILASAAVPLVMPHVEIGTGDKKKRYCDGALRETLPVGLAVKQVPGKMASHVVAIVCQPPRGVLGRVEQPGNIIHMMQRQIDIVADEIIKSDLALLRASNIKSIVIRPDIIINRDRTTKKIFEIDNFERHHVDEMINAGVYYARQTLGDPTSRFETDGYRDI